MERQAHGACDVLDGGNLVEDFFEAGDVGDVISARCLCGFDAGLPRVVAQQPVEALDLQAQQIRGLEGFTKLRERNAVAGLFGGAVGSQRGSFPAVTVRTLPYHPLSDASWSVKRLLRRLDTSHLGYDKAQILRLP